VSATANARADATMAAVRRRCLRNRENIPLVL
jgi:hypothetical protein